MRQSMFGDHIVESQEDDLGVAFIAAGLDPDECYALITPADGEDGISVEFLGGENGEEVCSTDPEHLKFADMAVARLWARSWCEDVQER